MSTTYRKMSPGGEVPTGSVTITENGTYDVTDKASAVVDVLGSAGVIRAKNCGASATVTATASGVSTVTATADLNGIAILFVPTVGTYTVASNLKTATKMAVVTNQSIVDVSFSRLPDGYTEVEYIESTGNQYIDAGVSVEPGFGISAKFKMNSNTGYETDAFGIYYTTNPNYTYFFAENNTKTSTSVNGLICGMQNKLNNYNYIVTDSTERYEIHTVQLNYLNSGKVIFDELERIGNVDTDFYSTNLNIYLFAVNFNGQVQRKSKSLIYFFKISKNYDVLREFVPCFTIVDGVEVIGMYDVINNNFYSNLGSGSFLRGNPV